MNDLTVISAVENEKGLVNYMIDSVLKFTNPTPKIIVSDNGRSRRFLDRYKDNPNITIVDSKPVIKGGSNRHAHGLNIAFVLVETKYTAIVESDCMILSENWAKMNDKFKLVVAVKSETEGIPFYHIPFVLFETEALRGISFSPKPGKKFGIGWEIPNYVSKEEVELLESRYCIKGNTRYFDKRFEKKSFELWRDGVPICAHFGRGSDLPRRGINSYGMNGNQQVHEWKKIAAQILA